MVNFKSMVDLLKIVLGLWFEFIGGQIGVNIEIVGFFGGGDVLFNIVQLMGLLLYGMFMLLFFEQILIFCFDDIVECVEIVFGGLLVVFVDGQIGVIENFIFKIGIDMFSGSIGVIYGNENLCCVDGFYSFLIVNSWYGIVGGFYCDLDGVCDLKFLVDKGGQFIVMLSYDSDNGIMMLYVCWFDDKNQFIMLILLIQSGIDCFSVYFGFDLFIDIYNGLEIQYVNFFGYFGGGICVNLVNGCGVKFNFFGGNFDYDLGGGWNVLDKFLIDGGDVDINVLFFGINLGLFNDMFYIDGLSIGVFNLVFGLVIVIYVKGGGVVDLNQSVIYQGWWYIYKYLKNMSNDFCLSKEIFEGNIFIGGIYFVYYMMNDKWVLGNQMLMINMFNVWLIQVIYQENGQIKYLIDGQGFFDYGGFNIVQYGSVINKVFYLFDVWCIGKWLFDLFGCVENQNVMNNVCNLVNKNFDGNDNMIYDNNVLVCDGIYVCIEYDKIYLLWIFGVNYEFVDNMSVYFCVNCGVYFDDFDNGICGNIIGNIVLMQKIQNFEGGFKYQSVQWFLDLSVYYCQFIGLLYQLIDFGGVLNGLQSIYGFDLKGINVNIVWSLIEVLKFQLVGNYLDGYYLYNNLCLLYINLVIGDGCVLINGV